MVRCFASSNLHCVLLVSYQPPTFGASNRHPINFSPLLSSLRFFLPLCKVVCSWGLLDKFLSVFEPLAFTCCLSTFTSFGDCDSSLRPSCTPFRVQLCSVVSFQFFDPVFASSNLQRSHVASSTSHSSAPIDFIDSKSTPDMICLLPLVCFCPSQSSITISAETFVD